MYGINAIRLLFEDQKIHNQEVNKKNQSTTFFE